MNCRFLKDYLLTAAVTQCWMVWDYDGLR